MKRGIAILGSTGSIGTQALEVIRNHRDKFDLEVISANNNIALLIQQAIEFEPNVVLIANEEKYQELSSALEHLPIKVYAGAEALEQVVTMDSVQMVLTAMVGFSGLKPTVAAIEAGKSIALANKETMVVAGEMIMKLAAEKNVAIVPVDSEHSAIFQCLVGEYQSALDKVILTASGGPFRGKDVAFLEKVRPEQALNHPNWDMGPKITIDSASMMNKGLEVIEAKWLFGLRSNQIDVIIHPQSIIHSMVRFIDGSMKAQMGLPDMRLPIQYALAFPERIDSNFPRLDFVDYPNLSFQEADPKIFRNLAISFEAMEKGGNWPCIMNAANEVVVNAFLEKKVGFLQMSDLIEKVLEKSSYIKKPSLEDLMESDRVARIYTEQLI